MYLNTADLSGVPGCENLAAKIVDRESEIDILVNNAGVSWSAPTDDFPEIGWDNVFDTDVKGVFFSRRNYAHNVGQQARRKTSLGSLTSVQPLVLKTLRSRPFPMGHRKQPYTK